MPRPPTARNFRCAFIGCAALALSAGCSTLRTTDPSRTATEQFLLNEASRRSVEQLTALPLRDRLCYIDSSYTVRGEYTAAEYLYLIGELRARLLESGARMTDERGKSDCVVEMRVVGVGIDRIDTLIGLPSIALSEATGTSTSGASIATPELAIIKRLRQKGFAAIAYVAYWKDSGEIVTSSGPFVGKTEREDFWILGFGPRTVGDVPPAKE
jgi:hypothetical protein